MTPIEQQKAARKFVADWTGKALDKRDGEKLKAFVGFNYVF